MPPATLHVEDQHGVCILRLQSEDGTNRLTRALVLELTHAVGQLAIQGGPLIITGNNRFFSAGADLNEIAALSAPSAYEFARIGQALMQRIEDFPAPVYAAISGYCMGGGLDLALACRHRIASPHAVFGHRGAALGLITGWGGTQRLPRLIGKARALEMLTAAEGLSSEQALQIKLVGAIANDPVGEAMHRIMSTGSR
jgi:enoyl-CoA hydratase